MVRCAQMGRKRISSTSTVSRARTGGGDVQWWPGAKHGASGRVASSATAGRYDAWRADRGRGANTVRPSLRFCGSAGIVGGMSASIARFAAFCCAWAYRAMATYDTGRARDNPCPGAPVGSIPVPQLGHVRMSDPSMTATAGDAACGADAGRRCSRLCPCGRLIHPKATPLPVTVAVGTATSCQLSPEPLWSHVTSATLPTAPSSDSDREEVPNVCRAMDSATASATACERAAAS
jgi:hypothetical protein